MPTPDTAATPAGRPAWTLATPGVRRSPDGKLLAWYSGGHHYSWLANDGHNRTAEDVADWTPLVPAVSVPPVSPADTDGLRARIAAALEEMPSEFIAPDEFGAYEVDYEMAASIVLPLFEQ